MYSLVPISKKTLLKIICSLRYYEIEKFSF